MIHPWFVLAAVAVCGGLYGLGRWQGHSSGVESERSRQLAQLAEPHRKAADAEIRYKNEHIKLVEANQVVGRLLAYRPDPRVLIREVPTNAPVTSCPDRSGAYRLSYNAISSGSPEIAPEAVPAAPFDP